MSSDHPPTTTTDSFNISLWVATDLLGPLPNNEHLLVLIDYYSRYIEVKFVQSIGSKVLIEEMSEIFSRLGYPKKLKIHNGRQYVSVEFKKYCETNGIDLITNMNSICK